MLKYLKLLLEKNRHIKLLSLYAYSNTYGRYKKYKINKNFLKNAEKVLVQADLVFKELNMEYWLDFGTLLGAYRNKAFIKHDFDIDLGSFLVDYNPNNKQIFEKYGFKKVHEFLIDGGNYGAEETYRYLDVDVDIFYYKRINEKYAIYHDFTTIEGKNREQTIKEIGGVIPREITLSLTGGITYIDFLGKRYPAPMPIEEHLRDRYGNDFMIENSSWNMNSYNNNIHILHNKIGKVKIFD